MIPSSVPVCGAQEDQGSVPLLDRLRRLFGRRTNAPVVPGAHHARPRRSVPLPTLAQMRDCLRAGMPRDEFFRALDGMAESTGLRVGGSPDCVRLPVAEGGELLCFVIAGELAYVEYKGGIFLEAANFSAPTKSSR